MGLFDQLSAMITAASDLLLSGRYNSVAIVNGVDSGDVPRPIKTTALGVVNVTSDDPAALPPGAATEATLSAVEVHLGSIDGLALTPGTATAITPSDVTDTTALTAKGILVGVGGTVVVDGVVGGVNISITAVAGQYLPIRAAKVKAASTATGLVGLS